MGVRQTVESLTPAQEAEIPRYIERWRLISNCTDPLNKPKAFQAADEAYRAAGLVPPKYHMHTDCPLSAAFMGVCLQQLYDGKNQQQWDVAIDEDDRLPGRHRAFLKELGLTAFQPVLESFLDQLMDEVFVPQGLTEVKVKKRYRQALLHLEKKFRALISIGTDGPKLMEFHKAMMEMVNAQIYGSHDSWLCFYDFMQEVAGSDCSRVHGLMDLAKNCGWWLPLKEIVICENRASAIHLEDGRLNCETGPAIDFRQKILRVWSIRGVMVDEQIVMRPESQQIEQMQKEQNAEVKRIRIERFGWHKYLEACNAKLLDERVNDIDMTKEALLSGDNMRVLLCSCRSTGRVYSMEVDNKLTTCLEAQSWLANKDSRRCIGAS